MSVAITAGKTLESGTPVSLFRSDSLASNAFDVSADGQRFILVSSAAQTRALPFTVVVNWTADLKR